MLNTNFSKVILMSATLTLCGIAQASVNSSDPWKIEIAPYLWAINMNGHVQVGAQTANVNESFSDIMQNFDGGGMLFVDAHKNKFGLFANALYTRLSKQSHVGPFTINATNKFGIFSGGASYQIFEREFGNASAFIIEPYFGARYTLNNTTISVANTPISATKNVSWTDPILGARFHYTITKAWLAILSADAGGTGNKDYSYNFNGLIGYKPQTTMKWATFYLGYRYLYQYYGIGSGPSNFLWNMKLFGPVLGFSVTF